MTKILPRLARKALESSGASEMSVLGYCMGAPLSACFARHAPGVPAQELRRHGGARSTSPRSGSSASGSTPRYFDVDKYVDTLGTIPADMVKIGFKLLKPTMDSQHEPEPLVEPLEPGLRRGLQRAQQVGERVPAVPGRVLPPVGEGVLPAEQAGQGRARDGAAGRVELCAIACPVLAVGAKEDNIAPPACVKPLIGAVSSTDKEYVELPGGHISLIAGRGASVHCWPKVAAWLAARSYEEARHGGQDGQSAALRPVEAAGGRGHAGLAARWPARGSAPDPQAFWRPFMDQGMAAWSKVMTQGTALAGPDGASGSSSSTSGSPRGRRCSSRRWAPRTSPRPWASSWRASSTSSAPVKKAAEQQIDAGLAGLGLPSRSQVIGAGHAASWPARGEDRRRSRIASTRSSRRLDASWPPPQDGARMIGITIDAIAGRGQRARSRAAPAGR